MSRRFLVSSVPWGNAARHWRPEANLPLGLAEFSRVSFHSRIVIWRRQSAGELGLARALRELTM